jgi:hypothetical protein
MARSAHAHRAAAPRWLLPAAGIAGLGGLAYLLMRKRSYAPIPPPAVVTSGIGLDLPFSRSYDPCAEAVAQWTNFVTGIRGRVNANPYFDARTLSDVDDAIRWIQSQPAVEQQACPQVMAMLQAVRSEILTTRGINPSGIGPLFGPSSASPQAQVPGVHGPPVAIPSSFSSQVQQPSIVVRSFDVGMTPLGPVGPPTPLPSPVFVPQRGGPVSAAAAARSVLTEDSAIHGWR